jgi:hypothetical protein
MTNGHVCADCAHASAVLHLDELDVLIEMLTQARGGMTSWTECLAANEEKPP